VAESLLRPNRWKDDGEAGHCPALPWPVQCRGDVKPLGGGPDGFARRARGDVVGGFGGSAPLSAQVIVRRPGVLRQ
jgi:hypothetical protein